MANYNMMFTRSTSDLAIKLLYILAVNARAMNIQELALWANRDDDEKVRRECSALVDMGYLQVAAKEKNEKFYSLADSMQAMLPGFAQILPAPVENLVSGFPETKNLIVIEAGENGPENSQNQQKQGENAIFEGRIAPVSGKPETGDSSLESLDSSSLLRDLKDSNSLDSGSVSEKPDTEFERILEGKTCAETLCREAWRILGKPVRCDDTIRARTIEEILGWMAQAYQERDNLSSPWGIVYRGLRRELKKRGKVDPFLRPDPQYAGKVFEFLPSEYLTAVGLENYIVVRCKHCGGVGGEHTTSCVDGMTEYHQVETSTVVVIEKGAKNPELDARRNGGKSKSINDAWIAVLTQMQAEMPRASYDTWVKDTMPADWDEQANTITVAARNTYAAEWLESRMAETCQRLLAEQLDAPVVIEFVARQNEGEED